MHGFRVNAVPNGDTCTLIISGEADVAAVPDIITLGTAALDEAGVTTLVIDLAAVTFLDSTALGSLISLYNTGDQLGKKVALHAVPSCVQRVFEITGLDGHFAVTDVAMSHPATADDPDALAGTGEMVDAV